MIGRPYRSGAQQRCLLERCSEDIQENVLDMVDKHTYNEISEWLKTQGTIATWSQIRYFVKKRGKLLRKYVITPKKTYQEKLIAYIDELLKYSGETYTIHCLHMQGSSWTTITAKLHAAGMIHPLREYPPIQWRIVGTKDEISTWRDAEMIRIEGKP